MREAFLALITPIEAGGGGTQPPAGGAPGYPTHPWVPPYGPSHPIAPGGPPLGIWGGVRPPFVDIGFPGNQPYPDQGLPPAGSGGSPSHPIFYPPVIWDPSRPSNPITNPGDPNDPGAGQPVIEWKTAWSPSTGWVVVGVPTGEHVTPSGSTKPAETKPAEPKK